MTDPPPDLGGKVVLVTGANSGIGLEASVELARLGATVALACRDPERGRAARDEVRRRAGVDDAELVRLDLASFASIREAAAEVLERWDRLDVLVANAGGILSERRMTEDGFEMTFGVNHLGHFLLTDLLLERLVASAPARVVVTSSLAHRGAFGGMSWADLDRSGRYVAAEVYAESKLANILFTFELAERTAGTGVTANCCHPGSVRSGFGAAEDTRGFDRIGIALARPFSVGPVRGAEPLVHLAAAPELEGVTGTYVVGGYQPGIHRRTPSRAARDPEAARRLWELSEALVAGAAGLGA
jgi:NAD(P)-dependent dehydrogenase (short-subunit alcohol dehydrogenase family)